MLKALVRHGVTADLVVGASVGAINAAYFAADPNSDGVARLELVWQRLTRADIFPLSPLNSLLGLFGKRSHLVTSAPLRLLIESELPLKNLEDTRVFCYVTATDVLKGTEVVLSSGPAVEALLASAAIPAIFPFVRIADRQLMDGGITNNTPISVAVDLGATRVVVLPTGISCALQQPPVGAMAVGLHALNLLIMRQLVDDLKRFEDAVELVTVPPLCPLITTPYDFSHSKELIRRAEATTRLWLKNGGLERAEIPGALEPHSHTHAEVANATT